ncbi:Endothelin-converting protein [Fasciola hepatica]|uniref:Endothelin-converting protein n=1 Tax=Fasciola hepatica TaxID=6192 RepID=A0A4E0R8V2_FASHE|nr:Endothelin-converting protein [Fasciola hepatica]
MSPIEVNAVYLESRNEINIPAGILQNPFYCDLCPTVYNYGSLGEVIGHELTHALDYEGSKRDSQGNVRNWWTNKTREVFKNRTQCMVEQYSKYSVLNEKVDGKLTLNENIADNTGVEVAFKVSFSFCHFGVVSMSYFLCWSTMTYSITANIDYKKRA